MIGGALSEAASLMRAELHGPDGRFDGVSTDSRRVRAGELFFALRGPSFDGHAYAAAALAAGAAAAVVQRPLALARQLLCDDVLLALGRLGAAWRERCAPQLIAVTGSNGKTTVKEILATILAGEGETLATAGNLNNAIGVPLSLLRLAPQHRFAVLELGASHAGEIAYLTALVRPAAAIITNAGVAHLEGFGSIEGVARAKGEIFSGLEASGSAVINADDRHSSLWRELAGAVNVISFGVQQPADVRARLDGERLTLTWRGSEVSLRAPLPGQHNASNAAAATAGALALGVPLARVARALERVRPVSGRLEPRPGRGDARLIDDTYNANPESLAAALRVLAEQPAPRKWLLLGDMAELGPGAGQLHREAGQRARAEGVERLYAVGPLAAQAAAGFGAGAQRFDTVEEAVAALGEALHEEVCLLIKGSRSMRMERAVAALTRAGEASGGVS